MAFVISHPPAPRQGGSGFLRSISASHHIGGNSNNNGASMQSTKAKINSISESNRELSSNQQLLKLRDNRQQQQQQQHQQTKMTKKQLKMAQAQLDKLTQINIHLHGM